VYKLCEHYATPIELSANKIHTSSPEQKLLYGKIVTMTGKGSAELFLGLEPDMYLYSDVCRKIDPHGKNWTEISWLSEI